MKYALSLLILASAVTTASAQSGAPTSAQMAEHQVHRYTEQLSLTSAQQDEATTIFAAAAASEASLRTEQRTAHTALAAAIVSGDAASIGQAATALGTLEGELTSARSLAEAKLYKLLTPDQQSRFAAMLAHPMGGPGPGGHGDHGGPPPPL